MAILFNPQALSAFAKFNVGNNDNQMVEDTLRDLQEFKRKELDNEP